MAEDHHATASGSVTERRTRLPCEWNRPLLHITFIFDNVMHRADHDRRSDRLDDAAVVSSLRDQVARPARVPATIHPRDEMFLSALKNAQDRRHEALSRSFSNGKRICDAVERIVPWYFGGWQHVGRSLDFAVSDGRGTSFLRQTLPPKRLWVSDIHAEAFAFLEHTPGVRGIVSSSRRHPGSSLLDPRIPGLVSSSGRHTNARPTPCPAWRGRWS